MTKVLIICASHSDPVRVGVNTLVSLIKDKHEIFFIEEKVITFRSALRYLAKRFSNKGIFSTLDFALLKFISVFRSSERVEKQYSPDFTANDINSESSISAINSIKPELIVTLGCSILRRRLLQVIECPIINIHPGIAPRYRGGGGNLWAIHESNLDYVGVTVHLIDEGIDTGLPVAISPIPRSNIEASFDDIDCYAFELGAKLLSAYIADGSKELDTKYLELDSKIYSYPGLSHYMKAKKNWKKLTSAS